MTPAPRTIQNQDSSCYLCHSRVYAPEGTGGNPALLSRRGIAMPIIFGLVLCLAIWVASLSWTMTNSRARYQQVLKARKAYFMARSGMQHLFLKLKTMQRHCIEAMQSIENANDDEKKLLYSVFIEDIIVPPDDSYTGEKYEYRVNEFKVESIDHEESKLTLQVGVEGSFGGQKNSISRLIRISR